MIGQGKSFRVIENKKEMPWFKLIVGDKVKLTKEGIEYASEGSDIINIFYKI